MTTLTSLRARLALLVCAAVAGTLLLATVSAWQIRSRVLDGKRRELVNAVQTAFAVVSAYQRKAASGEMPLEKAQEAAKQVLLSARYGDRGADYFYAYQLDGVNIVLPSKPDWAGKNMIGKVLDASGTDVILAMTQAIKQSANGEAFVRVNFPHPGETVPAPKLQYVRLVPDWNWMVGSGLYLDDAEAQGRAALLWNLGATLAGLVALAALGFIISRSVLRQIGGEPHLARGMMREVAHGNLGVAVPAAPPGSLLEGLGETVVALRKTVDQVRGAAAAIGTASTQIAAGSMDLSSRSERVAANLQQTAATVEELNGTVAGTSDSARRASGLAARASDTAGNGRSVIGNVVSTMDGINESSRRISEIIGVIDGIAFQTNILALNAAVEAARAGEQGRGFAVVAGEVRTLARRSAQAAREIKALIVESVARVETGTQLVSQAEASMGEIVTSVARVRTIIDEIAAATRGQSNGIAQVNLAIAEIDRTTQQNAALVEESSAATASLNEQTLSLSRSMAAFKL